MNNHHPDELTASQICSQRLSCLAGLSGGIIHELHNALGAINSNLKSLSLTKARTNAEHLAFTQQAINRINHLAQMLTLYTRDALIPLEPVSIRKVFKETVARVQAAPGHEGIKFHWQNTLAGKHCALTNELLLRKALEAIMHNACESLGPEVQQISLSLDERKNGGELGGTIRLGSLDPSVSYLCCHIQDAGCGIPLGNFPLIFDPFFTTKMRARGMGLAYVVGLVLQANAILCCQSNPGKGTCFTLCLPVATA